jgi:hypothetical protein
VSQHLGVLRSGELIMERRGARGVCTGPTTSRWKGARFSIPRFSAPSIAAFEDSSRLPDLR